MVRTIKKALSTVLVLTMTLGAIVVSGGNTVYAADDSGVQLLYVNSEYVSEYNGDKYIELAQKDNKILISGSNGRIADNLPEKTNCADEIELTAQSVFTYISSDGVRQEISNSNADGSVKYNSIYGGLTRMVYDYVLVGVKDKIGFMDKDGNLAEIGNKKLYDDIYLYNTDLMGICYGLKEINSDGTFNFTLEKEDGTIIFSYNNCKEMNKYSWTYWYSADYFVFQFSDESLVLVDITGKEWARESVGIIENGLKLIRKDDSGRVTVCVNYDNGKCGVYNYADGKKFLTDGKGADDRIGYIGGVTIKNNNDTYFYNVNMEKLYGTQNGVKYFIGSDGVTEIKASDIYKKAIDLLNISENQVKSYSISIEDREASGVIIKILDNSGKTYYVYSPKQSDYNNMYIINPSGQNYVSMGRYWENCDKTITYSDGHSIQLYYRVKGIRYSETGIELYDIDDKTIYTRYMGIYNAYDENGNFCSMVYNEEKHIFQLSDDSSQDYSSISKIGNTGVHIKRDSSGSKYEVYNADGTVLDIGLNEMYSDSNIRWIDLSQNNYWQSRHCITRTQDMGYFTVEYNQKDIDKDIYKIYSYTGELVLSVQGSSSIRIVYPDKYDRASVICIGDKCYQLKDLCKSLIEDTISDVNINVNAGVGGKFIEGIHEKTSVTKVKDMLSKGKVIIRSSSGDLLSDNSVIGTGCIVDSIHNGTVSDSATIVIKGDTDGTGTIDVLDMEAIQKSILGIGDKLSGAYKEAASLTGGEDITVLDMETVQKDILGIQKIN